MNRSLTFRVYSSAESQEPIFNSAVKAGAAAEPYSRAEVNKGNNCRENYEIINCHEIMDDFLYLKKKKKRRSYRRLVLIDLSHLTFKIDTFFNTIWRGSCSVKLGSLRKKVSFSTLSFKLRISIKCIVSTNLFWKYSGGKKHYRMWYCRKAKIRQKKEL